MTDPTPFASPDPTAQQQRPAPADPFATPETIVMNDRFASEPASTGDGWQAPAVIALFLVIVGIAALAGVALGSGASPREKAALAAPPAEGACLVYDARTALGAHEQSAPVPCTDPHSAQTYAVQIDALPAPGEDGNWTEEQTDDAADVACASGAASESLGLSDEDFDATRFTTVYFVPTPEQAQAGARWLRCDVVLTDSGDLTSVAGPFADLVTIDGAFAVCIEKGVLGERVTRCDDDPSLYVQVGTVDLGAYGSDLVRDSVQASCETQARAESIDAEPRIDVRFPSDQAWRDGADYAVCFLRADQWDVDRSAWPAETRVGGAGNTTSV